MAPDEKHLGSRLPTFHNSRSELEHPFQSYCRGSNPSKAFSNA